jgi:hypothetical protein
LQIAEVVRCSGDGPEMVAGALATLRSF